MTRQAPAFVPGLELAEGFFHEHVAPVLARGFPSLHYSAGLVGSGSEVLGFDSEMSTDHHWGPRVELVLSETDLAQEGDAIRERLAHELPSNYRGYSTHFTPPRLDDNGTQNLLEHRGGPINHRVALETVEGFFQRYLGFSISGELCAADWLSFPTQKLRTITMGRVFRDDLGLDAERGRFQWYPDDVMRSVLGSLWCRVGQEEHLMGRAASVGDELGSALKIVELRPRLRALFEP